jgi:hypothetical protein
MDLICLVMALEATSFDLSTDIKILFFRVLITIEIFHDGQRKHVCMYMTSYGHI